MIVVSMFISAEHFLNVLSIHSLYKFVVASSWYFKKENPGLDMGKMFLPVRVTIIFSVEKVI